MLFYDEGIEGFIIKLQANILTQFNEQSLPVLICFFARSSLFIARISLLIASTSLFIARQ